MTILIFVIFLKSEKKPVKKRKNNLCGIKSVSQNSDGLTQKIIKNLRREKKPKLSSILLLRFSFLLIVLNKRFVRFEIAENWI